MGGREEKRSSGGGVGDKGSNPIHVRALRQRFREPLHLSDGLNSDIRHPLVLREARVRQDVDIGSSAEVALGARFMQLSAHEKNRCVLRYESVGEVVAIRAPRGAQQGQFQGQFWGQRGSRNSKPRVYLAFCMR